MQCIYVCKYITRLRICRFHGSSLISITSWEYSESDNFICDQSTLLISIWGYDCLPEHLIYDVEKRWKRATVMNTASRGALGLKIASRTISALIVIMQSLGYISIKELHDRLSRTALLSEKGQVVVWVYVRCAHGPRFVVEWRCSQGYLARLPKPAWFSDRRLLRVLDNRCTIMPAISLGTMLTKLPSSWFSPRKSI